MHGDSPRKWMSSVNGRARAVVGPATLVNTKLDPDLAFDRLAQAVNPFRAAEPVDRAPVRGRPACRSPNGVADVDRSIAVETKQIDVTVSGNVRFPRRDAGPLVQAASAAGHPDRDPADRGARALSRSVRDAGDGGRRDRVRDGARAHRRCRQHRRPVGARRDVARSAAPWRGGGAGACAVALGKAAPATAVRATRRRRRRLRRTRSRTSATPSDACSESEVSPAPPLRRPGCVARRMRRVVRPA